MTTLVRYHPRGIDIDLAELPAGLYNEIVSQHGQIDPPPAAPCSLAWATVSRCTSTDTTLAASTRGITRAATLTGTVTA